MTTRRTFLLGSIAIAGGVAIGYLELGKLTQNRSGSVPPKLPDSIDLEPGQTALTPYVVVDQSGITIITPRAEMGQGIHTTLAALVAEELDVLLSDIKVAHGPPSELYSNWVAFGPPRYEGRVHGYPTQLTGGQTSIKDAYTKMRRAGAAARTVLVKAAAETLKVDPMLLSTANGTVIDPGGRQLPYTELASLAATYEPPAQPSLKPSSEWKLLGRSLPRVDMLEKCTGTAQFAIDVRLPGMLYATVKRNPHLGGAMLDFDASKAINMRGVRKVIAIESGVVVVATNTWYALAAADVIEFDWGPAPYPASTSEHHELVAREMDRDIHYRPRDLGDVEAVLEKGPGISGEYRVPYLAHATMEPMNATAFFKNGVLEIWAGNQNPTGVVEACAKVTGISVEQVKVHTTTMGGGFGRRLEKDFAKIAAITAVSMEGTPVQVTWSREEDMTHDAYRPLALARFQGAVEGGVPVALDIKLSSPSLMHSAAARRDGLKADTSIDERRKDKFITIGAKDQPYQIENYRVTAYKPPNLLPVGWWRSVGESQNSFFHESIIDELAHAAGEDPLLMRLALLEHAPSRKVLEAVAETSNWGSDLPRGRARGVAYALSSGAATAQIMEVESTPAGIKILNAYVAADVGIALDPAIIEAQLEGALIFGLTAAIMGEISVTGGTVDQTNFHDYRVLRMHEIPPISVRIIESGEDIHGVGEAATPTTAPALGNAIFAATGRRLRELPFGKSINFV